MNVKLKATKSSSWVEGIQQMEFFRKINVDAEIGAYQIWQKR